MKCNCMILGNQRLDGGLDIELAQCSIHKAAFDLLEACKVALPALDYLDPTGKEVGAAAKMLQDAIQKAKYG